MIEIDIPYILSQVKDLETLKSAVILIAVWLAAKGIGRLTDRVIKKDPK
jgi:hypothetical protein